MARIVADSILDVDHQTLVAFVQSVGITRQCLLNIQEALRFLFPIVLKILHSMIIKKEQPLSCDCPSWVYDVLFFVLPTIATGRVVCPFTSTNFRYGFVLDSRRSFSFSDTWKGFNVFAIHSHLNDLFALGMLTIV